MMDVCVRGRGASAARMGPSRLYINTTWPRLAPRRGTSHSSRLVPPWFSLGGGEQLLELPLAPATAAALAAALSCEGAGPRDDPPVLDSPSKRTRGSTSAVIEQLSRTGSTSLDALKLYMVPGAKSSRLRPLTELVQAVWVDYQLTAKPDGPIELSFVFLRGLSLALQHSKSGESGMQSLKRALHLEGGEGSTALTSPSAKTIADQVGRRVVMHAEQNLRNILPTQEAVIRFLIRHDFRDADQHLMPFMPQFEGGGAPLCLECNLVCQDPRGSVTLTPSTRPSRA
jgi:hypothetical protein